MIRFACEVDGPIRIRASAEVVPEALEIARERVDRLLAGCPQIAANLASAGAELQLLAEREAVTDLPQYHHLKGVKRPDGLTMDERSRGYGGLHACTAEEALLCLPSARHADHRDVCSHEVAHQVLDFGLDATLRARVQERYAAARAEGLWEDAYAGTNVDEFFAETTMWFVGSRGDQTGLPSPRAGRTWLAAYDPQTEALLAAIYEGRLVPEPLSWVLLEPTEVDRSKAGEVSTRVVFDNRTDGPLTLCWLDYRGRAVPYGTVPAHGIRSQSTWVTHAWRFGGGSYVAVEGLGRAVQRDSDLLQWSVEDA